MGVPDLWLFPNVSRRVAWPFGVTCDDGVVAQFVLVLIPNARSFVIESLMYHPCASALPNLGSGVNTR